jgi:putative lipoprotein
MIGGCRASEAEPEEVMDLKGTMWITTLIEGDRVDEQVQSTIAFEDESRIVGKSGCNRYFGMAKIDGSAITFASLGMTRMACPEPVMDQEMRFLEALERSKRFEVQEGVLLMLGDGKEPLLRFSQIKK